MATHELHNNEEICPPAALLYPCGLSLYIMWPNKQKQKPGSDKGYNFYEHLWIQTMKDINSDHHPQCNTCQPQKLECANQHGINENSSVTIYFFWSSGSKHGHNWICIHRYCATIKHSSKADPFQNGKHQINWTQAVTIT